MGVLSLAPAGLSSFAITITQSKENIISNIGTATIEVTPAIGPDDAILHHTSIALVANTSNWRKVAKELIGDEPVTYAEKSKKDTLRRFPIINIMSTDEEALKRVLTKAAEVE